MPRGKSGHTRLADGHGLYLLVAPTGARYWRFDYRFNAKRLTLSLGAYPEISLSQARDDHAVARKQLRDGLNPMEERKVTRLARAVARATTFGAIADELLAKLTREQKAAVTIDKRRWLLKGLAAPLCPRPISAITPAEVLGLLRTVEEKGHLETARRLRASIGQVLRLAVATNRAPVDFTPSLRGAIAAPKTTHRAAIRRAAPLPSVMAAIDGYDRPVVRAAMLVMAYCFPRPIECRLASWPEVDFGSMFGRFRPHG